MNKNMEPKVVLVTGGSAGMGRAAAQRLGTQGATVVVAARDEARGEETVDRIKDAGGRALFVRTDVTVEEDVAAAVRTTVDTFGRLDAAFNNAGGGDTYASVHTMETSAWRQTMALNLDSVYYSLRYEVPAILASGGGSILNNASGNGVIGHESMHAYTAAKHGVVGLTRSAALRYSRQGVRVNSLITGVIRTPLFVAAEAADPETMGRLTAKIPIGRVGEEDEIAKFVSFLLGDESSYITGAALAIDGAITAGLIE